LASVSAHSFFKELYQKIADEPAPEERDKIRAALISKDNCAVWSKIIARHPSEWKHPSGHGTWSVLDKLLKSVPELLDHEKERIDKCVWWDDVAGKVPGFDRSGVVWHFHPVGVVSVQGTASGRWKLGTTSEQFETGGRGVATISTGSGDFGGVSYGSYQLSSSLGVVQKFIAQSSYKQEFATLEVNSDKFKKKWKEIAEREPEEFEASQHQFIKATHYDVQMNVSCWKWIGSRS
jgi:hypothetical protein